MKNNFRYIFLAALAGLTLAGCHDFKDDYMVPDTVYLRSASDLTIQDYSVYDATSLIGVIKAGKGRTAALVTLGVAPTDTVLAYNERNSTNYLPLSKSLYNADELDGMVLGFSASEARKQVPVKWDPKGMVDKMMAETDDYVIPVYIKESSLDISDSKYLLLIHPVLSTLDVRSADNGMTCKSGATFVSREAGLKLDRALSRHDVKVKLSFAPKAVTVNGIDYEAAPVGSIELAKDEVTIKAGDQEVDIELNLSMASSIVPTATTYISGEIKIESVTIVVDGGDDIDFMPVLTDKMVVRVRKTS
ncbi:MAG: DUF1735 domain-containing protein [Bacteroidales bacterium]|nr:DUF1735 domain-containing protein [Bacteroidales bacterium]